MLLVPLRTHIFIVAFLLVVRPGIASQNEAVNWRVWNTSDGMLEAFVSQVSRTPAGRIIVRHGDVTAMDILDGFHLANIPDAPSLGLINASRSENLYTFGRAGVAIFSQGKWNQYGVPDIAKFAGFGTFEHLRWFEYPFNTDLNPRIGGIPTAVGDMLFTFAGGVVRWSKRGPQTVLRESAKSGIGDFIQISPAGEGTYFVSGVHGLAILAPDSSGWTELPQPTGTYSNFVFPSQTQANGILTTATGPDGRKRLLSLKDGRWKLLYTGGLRLRGWESGGGRLWAMEPERLTSLGNGPPRQVNLDQVVSGQLNDVARDGDAFWLATAQGVARYSPPLWQVPDGSPELRRTVNNIAQDRQGTLWFTAASLLISHNGAEWKTYQLPQEEAQDTGKTNSLCPLDNGHLIVMTGNTSHLLDMNVVDRKLSRITHPEGRKFGFIARRDANSVWVQTVQRGDGTSRIEVYDGKIFTQVPGAGAVPITDLRAILQTKAGVLWIGGTGNLVRVVNGVMEKIPVEEGAPEPSAFSLLEAPDHTIYVGHRDVISAYVNHRFHVLKRGVDRARKFAISPDGTLWAASGTGVHRLKDGVWLTNASEEGLPSSAVYTVFVDNAGKIWAGTTLGLCVYHPESDRDPPTTSLQESQNQRQAPPGGEVRFVYAGADRWKQTPDPRLLFSWSLDGGRWSNFQSATLTSIQDVPSGSHNFRVRAMDRNGNVDPHPAHFQFTVLVPWYRETGFCLVFGILSLAIVLLMKTGYAYHKNLRFQSRHDSLTGLPNRLQFEQALSAATEERNPSGLAVLFIDLDGFKGVNDTHGHPEGDRLLVAIGHALRASLPKCDMVARIGGDEFAVLHFSRNSRATSALLAEAILETVRACSPKGCKVSASIGISLWPEHGLSPCALVCLADLAMYQSKSRNGDCGLIYESSMKVDFRSAEMAGVIRAAVAQNRLVLWYQPIVDSSRRVVRMECLVRIDDPDLGLIEPGLFIKVAEDSGLIHEIGKWVLTEALRTAKEWRESGCPMAVAVNISPLELESGQLAADVLELLREFELPASVLTLEMTEGAVARNRDIAATILSDLKSAGVNISLDDFGTGFSGLNMLDSIPLNEIKLDLSFVSTIDTGRTRDVVSQSVTLAHKLNFQLVVEGIEEASQFEIARELGCDLFQGHLIAPPLDRDMATEFILNETDRTMASIELLSRV